MKKRVFWLPALLLILSLSACSREPYVVQTIEETPMDQVQTALDNGKIVYYLRHMEMSDGTWVTAEHTYKYRLEITGRMHNAAMDTTYIILSNIPDITFDQAWKSSGLSSTLEDYFQPEDAVHVGIG